MYDIMHTGSMGQQVMCVSLGRFTHTHRSQSMGMSSATSSGGKPTATSTITIVTSPALGTLAAPILAAVAVILR